MGLRIFPVVGWAERGDGRADGHGNSVPRFHLTWGTGPGVVEPFERRVREHAASGRLRFAFRHRVDELVSTGSHGAATGDGRPAYAGRCWRPTHADRGRPTNREEIGDFELTAQAVIVSSGGIGGNHDLVRKSWPARLGTPPGFMVAGVPAHVDGRMLGITRDGRRRGHQRGPDVALRRGHPQLGPDLGQPRHPDPPGSVLDVVRRRRAAPARAVPPGLRHPRHPASPARDRLRLLVVRAHPEDHREGVRALGLRAEPRPDRQGREAAARPRRRRRCAGAGRGVQGARRGLRRRRHARRPGAPG